MEITDHTKIPQLIYECGEDTSMLNQLKYVLLDIQIELKHDLTNLERDDRGLCLDVKEFNRIKTFLQYVQRYLIQLSDILKSISKNSIAEKSLEKVISKIKLKDDRDKGRHDMQMEKQRQIEEQREAKHQRELERLEKHNKIRELENDVNIKRHKLFINSIKTYIDVNLWDSIWLRVDSEIPKH